MSVLDKIKGGKRDLRIVKFPGTDQDVALRVLSSEELQEVAFATEKLFADKNIKVTATTIGAYEDENTTQILFRALRDPIDPDQPFAKDVDELRRLLVAGEKDILVELYSAFEQETSSFEITVSEEEEDGPFEKSKQNPGAHGLRLMGYRSRHDRRVRKIGRKILKNRQ
jgi:hypothetical protein